MRSDVEAYTEHLFEELSRLYRVELPLSEMFDESDLVLKLDGLSDVSEARASVVAHVLDAARRSLASIVRIEMDLPGDRRLPLSRVDLNYSAIKSADFYIGLSATSPNYRQLDLFEHQRLEQKIKDAAEMVAELASKLGEEPDINDLERADRELGSAEKRDAAFVAVKNFSPTNRRGLKSIGLKSSKKTAHSVLTPSTRSALNTLLRKPILDGVEETFVGTVRAVDLDSRRFELRNLDSNPRAAIRCVFPDDVDLRMTQILNLRVTVSGLAERGNGELPTLMKVTTISEV